MKPTFFKNLSTNAFLVNFMAVFSGLALILTVF